MENGQNSLKQGLAVWQFLDRPQTNGRQNLRASQYAFGTVRQVGFTLSLKFPR